ncbi:hypothetical protein DSM104443_04050 [Usitatibacter rugosus]|uniref:Lipoprotein n=1 Tax=Usitatibacter rugosus TaxID=2732067 RepID=A0A6M4H0E0_9PROT|nr:hypothetical protein [Usitatibacter rugosus]QJR12956.1 hypothetical protein DSM104443_04050 [Usitatibacter rugosus]
MCPHPALLLLPLLLGACAATPFTAPNASGKGAGDVTRLVAASETKLFACNILEVRGVRGSTGVELGATRSEVTLLPGHYDVTLFCSNGQHSIKPRVQVNALGGKGYRLAGYLVDDSITIFHMKMAVRVAELP